MDCPLRSARPQPVAVAPGPPLRRALLAALAAVCGLACAGPRTPPPSSADFERVWQDYRALPANRSLAVAGSLRRGRWVAAGAGGHDSVEAARSGAIEACRVRRERQRMRSPCRTYAVGDEVVWKGP